MNKNKLDDNINFLLEAQDLFEAKKYITSVLTSLKEFHPLETEMLEYTTKIIRRNVGSLFNTVDTKTVFKVLIDNAAIKYMLWHNIADPLLTNSLDERYLSLTNFLDTLMPTTPTLPPTTTIEEFLSILNRNSLLLTILRSQCIEPLYISLFPGVMTKPDPYSTLAINESSHISNKIIPGKNINIFEEVIENETFDSHEYFSFMLSLLCDLLIKHTMDHYPSVLKHLTQIAFNIDGLESLHTDSQLASISYFIQCGICGLCGDSLKPYLNDDSDMFTSTEWIYMTKHTAFYIQSLTGSNLTLYPSK